jgi:hypothetical protein
MKDAHIVVKWNAQTCMYQAKVDYKGSTSTFALPDAANDWEARNQAERVMAQYARETKNR